MKAARRCRQAGLRVSIVDILSEPNIDGLARSIESKGWGLDNSSRSNGDDDDESFVLSLDGLELPPHVEPDDVAYIMPCTPMQEDYYHLFSASPAPERPGVMTICYEITCRDGRRTVDAHRAARAWQAIADRHPMFRTCFVPLSELGVTSSNCDPLPPDTVMQIVMRRWRIDCAVVHVDSDSDEDMKQYSAVHTANTLYRTKPASCVSVRLFVTPAERVYMNVVLWHISADFVATGVFQADFDRFYRGVLPNRSAPGFDLYVHNLGLTTRRGQAAVESGTRYWIDYLRGAKPCWIRPQYLGVVDKRSSSSDYSDPDGKELTCVTNLGRASCRLLVTGPAAAYCSRCHVLPSTIFRLAYALTLSKFADQEDVCFSYLISDRDREIPDVDGILGMMMTYFYARIEATPSARLVDLMLKVHDDDLAHRRHLVYRPKDVASALSHDKPGNHYGVLPVTNLRFNDRRIDIPQGLELSYRGVISNLVQELFISLILVPEANGDYVLANFSFKKVLFTEDSVQRFADVYACVFHALATGSYDTVADVMSHIKKEVVQI
ncbi:condensation domain-containing protein [Colletotrichum cereale]|nr:condensation domain-containing protein [Colletotrichum cereale]